MKTRTSFVANSSSSSFILKISDLTVDQYRHISNHIEVANKMDCGFYADESDRWMIEESGDEMILKTFMDNFDMDCFLRKIGVTKFKYQDR